MHRKNFFVLPAAQRDQRSILRGIARDNPTASVAMRKKFHDAFCKLGDQPFMGSIRDDLTSLPVRFWPVHPNYMIVYNPASAPIQILRILHSARDLSRILQ